MSTRRVSTSRGVRDSAICDSHLQVVKASLDAIRTREDLRARRSADPVDFVHRYVAREDRELVALVSSACAFGHVKVIHQKLTELFALVGPSPSHAADAPRMLLSRLSGFRHRLFRGDDLARLLIGARAVQREAGSLGAAFVHELAKADRDAAKCDRDETAALRASSTAVASESRLGRSARSPRKRTCRTCAGAAAPNRRIDFAQQAGELALKEALASFCDRIRIAGGFARAGERNVDGRRGPSHLLPDARAGSAAKRILLFLRWMVRPADGVDLGLWDVPTSRLVIPVDVHIHKLAKNLGLTSRRDVSWKTAVEITRALTRFDARDPVRYDFSLCHMGMIQRCPSRRDPSRCTGCGVKRVCTHWAAPTTIALGRLCSPPDVRDFMAPSVRA
ncbi:MAG: TIGR02757 family protein [Polyangiaceae bacterium]|nr:TIGR02757 family protein [Polyangiaceae bacterium]